MRRYLNRWGFLPIISVAQSTTQLLLAPVRAVALSALLRVSTYVVAPFCNERARESARTTCAVHHEKVDMKVFALLHPDAT